MAQLCESFALGIIDRALLRDNKQSGVVFSPVCGIVGHSRDDFLKTRLLQLSPFRTAEDSLIENSPAVSCIHPVAPTLWDWFSRLDCSGSRRRSRDCAFIGQ
jgi:hypothetical protein